MGVIMSPQISRPLPKTWKIPPQIDVREVIMGMTMCPKYHFRSQNSGNSHLKSIPGSDNGGDNITPNITSAPKTVGIHTSNRYPGVIMGVIWSPPNITSEYHFRFQILLPNSISAPKTDEIHTSNRYQGVIMGVIMSPRISLPLPKQWESTPQIDIRE